MSANSLNREKDSTCGNPKHSIDATNQDGICRGQSYWRGKFWSVALRIDNRFTLLLDPSELMSRCSSMLLHDPSSKTFSKQLCSFSSFISAPHASYRPLCGSVGRSRTDHGGQLRLPPRRTAPPQPNDGQQSGKFAESATQSQRVHAYPQLR